MISHKYATIEDLYSVPENGKAEIVDGELVLMSPTGHAPSRAGGTIYMSLRNMSAKLAQVVRTQLMPASRSIFRIVNPSAPTRPFMSAKRLV